MKMDCIFRRLSVVFVTALYAGSLWGTVRPLSGALFEPALVPTTNATETFNGKTTYRVIADNATMTGIEIDGILYSDVEGPTNAVLGAIRGKVYSPLKSLSIPSEEESVTGLTLDGLFNFGTVKMMFAGTVTAATEGGFFTSEWGNNECDIDVYPLDSNGDRIGTWMLHLRAADFGGGNLLRPHGLQLAVKDDAGDTTPVNDGFIGGASFQLTDFSGGSGVLNNVRGLEFTDTSPSFDMIVSGIYRGPGESVLYRAGRAVPMRNATFNQTLVNPMTNDFSLTGFAGAESIAAPSLACQFDSITNMIWPANGIYPSLTNSLLGLDINGVANCVYWDFMFADPVTNAVDGFFIIDQTEKLEVAFVYPLDAARRPISSYSIATLPNDSQWSPHLMAFKEVKWSGSSDSLDGSSMIGGVVMPLSAFAGGIGGLTEVHGIRVCNYAAELNSSRLDPLVIGSYTAARLPRSVLDVETDPMPTPKLNANHITTDFFRHYWTLKSITLDTGRYTDLEGPTNMTRTATDGFRAYPIDGIAPATALDAALGLNGWISVNPGTCYWYFDTIVTNGFDGGFFVFNDSNDDSMKIEPLDANGNLIAGGYSVGIDMVRDLWKVPDNFMGIGWKYYAVTDTNPKANTNWNTSPRGAAFTLNCFVNASGDSLTNDVKGLKLTTVQVTPDVVMVGIYKGPPDPPETGYASPITAATFTPPLGASPYANDAAVASVQSAVSQSSSVIGPGSVAVLRHDSAEIFYPFSGTNPAGYTNALIGLDMDGITQTYASEYMFDKPVRKADEGFFIIESNGDDLMLVRPLAADRTPISTYSVQTDLVMMGDLGEWRIYFRGVSHTHHPKGTMIRYSDFAGGTEPLGEIYGIRIEDPGGDFDPAVVGQWFGTPDGTMILLR